MADGSPKRIDSLKAGDTILSATLDGAIALDTVSILSIADSESNGNGYISVTTDGKQTLNATHDHHVVVGATCCSEIKQMKKDKQALIRQKVNAGIKEREKQAQQNLQFQ